MSRPPDPVSVKHQGTTWGAQNLGDGNYAVFKNGERLGVGVFLHSGVFLMENKQRCPMPPQLVRRLIVLLGEQARAAFACVGCGARVPASHGAIVPSASDACPKCWRKDVLWRLCLR